MEDRFGKSVDLFPLLPAILPQKVCGQQGDVFPALPKGMDLHAKDIQPVIQVHPESPGSNFILEVAVGCGDDPDMHFPVFSTDGFYLPGLEHAQELCLQVGWQFPDLIEEKGPAFGLLEFSDPSFMRPGECTLFMTKKLAFDE